MSKFVVRNDPGRDDPGRDKNGRDGEPGSAPLDAVDLGIVAGPRVRAERGYPESRQRFDPVRQRQRLRDIVVAARKIERVAARGREAFLAGDFDSELIRDGVVKNIENIGEAVRALHSRYKDRFGHVEWAAIVSMRNRLTHAYDKIDYDIVWDTMTRTVPRLLDDLGLPRDADAPMPLPDGL